MCLCALAHVIQERRRMGPWVRTDIDPEGPRGAPRSAGDGMASCHSAGALRMPFGKLEPKLPSMFGCAKLGYMSGFWAPPQIF